MADVIRRSPGVTLAFSLEAVAVFRKVNLNIFNYLFMMTTAHADHIRTVVENDPAVAATCLTD